MWMFSLITLLPLITLTNAASLATSSGDCVGTISSLDDVDAATQCTTININSFTVPAGKTLNLNLQTGTTVNVQGDIQFGIATWGGPLVQVQGDNITFNGNKYIWNGGGPNYWDGLGGSGPTKPSPMMAFYISGTISGVHVVDSPERCFALSSDGPLIVRDVTVDNSQGQYPNEKSNGNPAGRNTDGFDVTGSDIVIMDSTVINQDDCVAINEGHNIILRNNYCQDGHGISIGSISSGVVVEDIIFEGNKIVNSSQAFRIKTDKTATNSRVSNVTYVSNTATGCTNYGVLITQSYPEELGTPGNGVSISDISFSDSGETDIAVASGAVRIAVNCGDGSCGGNWSWGALSTSGGKAGPTVNCPDIGGYNY